MFFTKHRDGSVTVDAFDDLVEIDQAFLDSAKPPFLVLDDNYLTITCANAVGYYVMIGYSHDGERYVYERMHQAPVARMREG